MLFLILIFYKLLVQFLQKIKSSFKPSRHWGPRDPITHYYWLARREEIQLDTTSGVLYPIENDRWRFGQMSQLPSSKHSVSILDKISCQDWPTRDIKRRANSDDWLYTRFRMKAATYLGLNHRQRSKSLDIIIPTRSPVKKDICATENGSSRNEVIDVICFIKKPKQSLSTSSLNGSNRQGSRDNIENTKKYFNNSDEHKSNVVENYFISEMSNFEVQSSITFKTSQEGLTRF